MSYDTIHTKPRTSIYERIDYIVNSDMTIPLSLANTWDTGVTTELAARRGLPANNRRPALSPLVLKAPRLNSVAGHPRIAPNEKK